MVTICTTSLTFNNSTFCPHSVFMCFVWIWEQTAIISLHNINWLVFITETVCLLRGTDWIFIYNSIFCPHSVFMCFIWIWEQTVIISLCSINWLVCITETQCVYCAVRTGCLTVIQLIPLPTGGLLQNFPTQTRWLPTSKWRPKWRHHGTKKMKRTRLLINCKLSCNKCL